MSQTEVVEAPRARLLSAIGAAERTIELAGIPTAILERGEGPPLILLHGPGEHAAKWMLVLPALSRHHRVIAPDLPGHGASAPRSGALEADRVLGWLAALVKRCPAPPVLVGQILGGAIAARFAAEHGHLLARLVLADSLGLAPFRPAPAFGQALADFLARPDDSTHDQLWQRCAFDLDRLRARLGERWGALKAYNLDCARLAGLSSVQRSLMEQFGLPAIDPAKLAQIRVPTTLVWGRHDLATPLEVAQAASVRYGWPLRVIEDAADDPALEQPEAFIEALR